MSYRPTHSAYETLSMESVAPPGGGQVAPPLSFLAVFSVRANPLRIFFEGTVFPPDPPNFCRFVVPQKKQAVKMYCLTCEFFLFQT